MPLNQAKCISESRPYRRDDGRQSAWRSTGRPWRSNSILRFVPQWIAGLDDLALLVMLLHVLVHGPVGSEFRPGHGSTGAFRGSTRPAAGAFDARRRPLEAPEACAALIRAVSARLRPGPTRHEWRHRLDSRERGTING